MSIPSPSPSWTIASLAISTRRRTSHLHFPPQAESEDHGGDQGTTFRVTSPTVPCPTGYRKASPPNLNRMRSPGLRAMRPPLPQPVRQTESCHGRAMRRFRHALFHPPRHTTKATSWTGSTIRRPVRRTGWQKAPQRIQAQQARRGQKSQMRIGRRRQRLPTNPGVLRCHQWALTLTARIHGSSNSYSHVCHYGCACRPRGCPS